MKKFVWNCISAVLALTVFALGVEYALEQSDAQDKAHFDAEVSRIEAKAKTQAMLDTMASQVLFYGLGGKLVICPLGVEVDSKLVGTKAIGMVEYNRLSLSFVDGTSFTTYIVDGVGDIMQKRFIVYIQ